MIRPTITAYYFPGYHPDPCTARWHGEGWTEWDLVKTARPRFEGHLQPKIPAWGYFDESDPVWAAREIDLAADYGIDVFIYDWYWYETGPFLAAGLENGFLKAPNRERLRFAIMWANHTWVNIHPANFVNRPEALTRSVTPDQFDVICDHIVANYFSRPNYWRIDGKPYFSIYEVGQFVRDMGGWDAAVTKLDLLRSKTRAAGFPGLHLNAVVWGLKILPSEFKIGEPDVIVRRLGADSATTYAWVHHYSPGAHGFPRGSYARAAAANYKTWEEYRNSLPIPYHPNVSMGWDSTPRCVQSDLFADRGYPWTAILDGNDPAAFGEALARACEFTYVNYPAQPVVTLNAWNEWTEGSYLLPDTLNGAAYLEEIRKIPSAFTTRKSGKPRRSVPPR